MAKLHIISANDAPIKGRGQSGYKHEELAYRWIREVCEEAGVRMPGTIDVAPRRALRSDKVAWIKVEESEYLLFRGQRFNDGKGTFWIVDRERYEARSRQWTSGMTFGTHASSKPGRIRVNYGTDWHDFQMTVLHEVAHWISPAKWHHSLGFYETAFSLYERYGLDMDRCRERETEYKPTTAGEVAARRMRD